VREAGGGFDQVPVVKLSPRFSYQGKTSLWRKRFRLSPLAH
jgi:hypothetical protein